MYCTYLILIFTLKDNFIYFSRNKLFFINISTILCFVNRLDEYQNLDRIPFIVVTPIQAQLNST